MVQLAISDCENEEQQLVNVTTDSTLDVNSTDIVEDEGYSGSQESSTSDVTTNSINSKFSKSYNDLENWLDSFDSNVYTTL